MKNHNSAGYYSLTGVAPPTDDQRLRDSIELFPAYGSIVDKLAPAKTGAATFVSFPHVTPPHAAFFAEFFTGLAWDSFQLLRSFSIRLLRTKLTPYRWA
jgi:hypothetical protein